MSKETKHTPGPYWPVWNGHYWDIKTRRDKDPIDVEPYKYGVTIASTVLDKHEIRTSGKEIEKANAHLFAAAPDLLDALERILEIVDIGDKEGPGWLITRIVKINEIASEAIEKATNQNIQQP